MLPSRPSVRIPIALCLSLGLLALDQWTKWLVFSQLAWGERIEVTSFFNIVTVLNSGITFGMFQDLETGMVVFSAIAAIITVALCVWLVKVTDWLSTLSLSLIISGAVGNLIDRLRIGAVMDFIDLHIGSWHWPAFNVADSAIVIGVILLCIEPFVSSSRSSS